MRGTIISISRTTAASSPGGSGRWAAGGLDPALCALSGGLCAQQLLLSRLSRQMPRPTRRRYAHRWISNGDVDENALAPCGAMAALALLAGCGAYSDSETVAPPTPTPTSAPTSTPTPSSTPTPATPAASCPTIADPQGPLNAAHHYRSDRYLPDLRPAEPDQCQHRACRGSPACVDELPGRVDVGLDEVAPPPPRPIRK